MNAKQHNAAVNTAPLARVHGTARPLGVRNMERIFLLVLSCLGVSLVTAGKFTIVCNYKDVPRISAQQHLPEWLLSLFSSN